MPSKQKISTADTPRRSSRNAATKRRKIESRELKKSKSPRGAKRESHRRKSA
jgi:hypothetical protein